MARRKKRLKKAQPGIQVPKAIFTPPHDPNFPVVKPAPIQRGTGLKILGIPGKKYPNTRDGHRQRMQDDYDMKLKNLQKPKPVRVPPPGVKRIRRDSNDFLPNPNSINPNPNLQKGGMTNKDLSKIQASNAKKNVMFNIMKDAYDRRKKNRNVGTTQYPPFMFPPTTMKRGGAKKMGMGGSCGRVILGKNLR